MSVINDYKVGMTVYGKISGIKPYGAFVSFEDGVNGLIHISEISNGFVRNISNYVQIGDYCMLKVIDVDTQTKQLRLSFKALEQNTRKYQKRVKFEGMPDNVKGFGSISDKLDDWIKDFNKNDKKNGENMLKLDLNYAKLDKDIFSYQEKVNEAHKWLHEKSGKGSDYVGWVEWPNNYDKEEFDRILSLSEKLKGKYDVLLVCGIGGSYLGARAALEMIRGLYPEKGPEVIFVGNTFSNTYISQVLKHIEGKDVVLNVISKSGTTTETALAFRIFKQYIEKRYGKEEARERIIATTDKNKGTLKALADKEGYEEFVVPDDIGGRYSVFTAVGLLPLALAGVDIKELMEGSKLAYNDLATSKLEDNAAYRYAVARRILNDQGYKSEMFVSYHLQLTMVGEWWKQLFGESEGKDGNGLLPTSVCYSTDLHSLGQFVQDGNKCLYETLFLIDNMPEDIIFPNDDENLDNMNYLSGKKVSWVNKMAQEGTLSAHSEEGGVPNIIINLKDNSAKAFGYMIYFFFKACGMTCYLLDINPFNQPGVEVYKKKMFKLLGKE